MQLWEAAVLLYLVEKFHARLEFPQQSARGKYITLDVMKVSESNKMRPKKMHSLQETKRNSRNAIRLDPFKFAKI